MAHAPSMDLLGSRSKLGSLRLWVLEAIRGGLEAPFGLDLSVWRKEENRFDSFGVSVFGL